MRSDGFRRAAEAKDFSAVDQLFSDDVVFRSPVVFKPYDGRDQLRMILSAVVEVFEDFRYVDQIEAGDSAAMGTEIDALERAFERTQRAIGSLGADSAGLDEARTRLSALRLAADTRRSLLEDANMAEAVTRLSQADTAYQAPLAAVSTAERRSLLDYLR